MNKELKIIISGGGTGGHIFPAIAIANALKNRIQYVDILFVGANGRMEMKRVPEAGYNILGLDIVGLQRKITFRNIIKNLAFPFKLYKSLKKAKTIINSFNPQLVIGVGGYASGPVLKIATKLKIPTLIQEQNSYPGLTNKLLAKKVSKICVAYDNMDKFFPLSKIIKTGNPIRKDILKIDKKDISAYNYFQLKNDKKTIAVVGGSLGSKTINESVLKYLDLFVNQNIQLIWQTGEYFYESIKYKVDEYSEKGIKIVPFITQMDYLYSVADLVISRAGAIAISEICCLAKASILVPSPNVSEDHQTKNALVLAKKKATLIIKDNEALDKLAVESIDAVKDDKLIYELEQNIKQFAIFNSDELIVDEVMKLLN